MTRILVLLSVSCLSLAGAFFVGRELGKVGRRPADAYRVHGDAAAVAGAALDGTPRFPAGVAADRGRDRGVFVRVAERLKPSVVTIQCRLSGGGTSGGTGIVVSADGAILTNHHVVKSAQEIQVELSSHDVFAASIVGVDPLTDLALIRIVAGGALVPATFAEDDDLRVGEDVAAVGNALDFGWTVTQGIVSSLHRSNLGVAQLGQYTDYIQTDAAINPGNSGGPLANVRGEVVGINVAVLANRADGIGFAIPSADAIFVARELMARGRVRRGYLGLESRQGGGSAGFRELTNEERRKLGDGVLGGALVTHVVAKSPAESAGFRRGDFIYALDGRPVEDYDVLRNRVARLAPGAVVEASVRRDGRDLRLKATVDVRPEPR